MSSRDDPEALRRENEELRDNVALLQKENERLRRFASEVGQLVAGFGNDQSQLEGELRRRRLDIRFEASHAQATVGYLGRQLVLRGQLFWLLRHLVLAAGRFLPLDEEATGLCFHWTWAYYLFGAGEPGREPPTIGNFRRQVTELNQAVSQLLTGDRRNRAAYLLHAAGWRAATYTVRLGTASVPEYATNIRDVDVLLQPPGSRDENAAAREADRCARAIAAIEEAYRTDRLAMGTVEQLRAMRAVLAPPAAGARDAWVEQVAALVGEVQSLRDYWVVSATGREEATVVAHREGGSEEQAAALQSTGPGEVGLSAAPPVVELQRLLERDVLGPLWREAEIQRRTWSAAGEQALFRAAKQAHPDGWRTPAQVHDFFFIALCVSLARDAELDALDRNLRERVVTALWRRVFPEGSPPPAPVSLFQWAAALSDGAARLLQQPEPLTALRSDWRTNQRRYER